MPIKPWTSFLGHPLHLIAAAPSKTAVPGTNDSSFATVNETISQASTLTDTSFWFDFAWIFLVAVILTLLVRKLADIFSNTSFRRWLPLTYTVIWTSSSILLAYLYAEGLPRLAWFSLLILLAIIFLVTFLEELRGVVAGIIMSFDHNIRIGDAIRIGDIEGKVTSFRMRFVRLEAPDGVVHDIPNTQFLKHVTSNFSEHGEHSRCLIRIQLPDSIPPQRAIDAARLACLLSPYASLYLKPEILLSEHLDNPERLQLNIYAFAFDQNVRESYRSDILSRLEKNLFKTNHQTLNKEH